MKFDFTDSLILYSIFCSEKNNEGAELQDIIAFADYANHLILDHAEFNEVLKKLIVTGIADRRGNRLLTSEEYKLWWRGKFEARNKIFILKIIESTEKYLNMTFNRFITSKADANAEISKDDYDVAVKQYKEKASKVLERLKSG